MEGEIIARFPGVPLEDIDPFQAYSTTPWQMARLINITVKLTKEGLVPPPTNEKDYQPRDFTYGPVNLNCVAVKTIFIRYVKNDSNEHVLVKRRYTPIFAAGEAPEQNKIIAAMGGVPEMVLRIPPHKDGPESLTVMKENPETIYLNEAFIKTFMMLTPEILMNGIIRSLEGFFIPYNHVMAWKLHAEEREKELVAKTVTITPKGVGTSRYILYFFVPQETFILLRNFCLQMINNVDKRPLSQVGVLFDKPTAEVTAIISYIAFPQHIPNPSTFIPSLDPFFPTYSSFLRRQKANEPLPEKKETK